MGNIDLGLKMSKVAIETLSVYKVYSSGEKEIQALKDVNIKIRVGGFVTVSGPAGAGKTTYLNIKSGIDKPSSGEVRILGMKLNEFDEYELAAFRCSNIGNVFQDYNLKLAIVFSEMADTYKPTPDTE